MKKYIIEIYEDNNRKLVFTALTEEQINKIIVMINKIVDRVKPKSKWKRSPNLNREKIR